MITAGDELLWSPFANNPNSPHVHGYRLVNAYSSLEYVEIFGHLVKDGGGGGSSPIFTVTVPAVDIDWVGYEAKSDEGEVEGVAPHKEKEYYRLVCCPVTSVLGEMRKFVVRSPDDDYSQFSPSKPTLILTFPSSTICVFDEGGNAVQTGLQLSLYKGETRTFSVSPLDNKAGNEFFITLEGPPGIDGGKPIDKIRGTGIKVDIDKIAFNYKPTTATDDALNIRENFTTDISVPEYVKGGQNKPAAYIKNKAVKMLVRLKVGPNTITSLKIKGVSDDTDGSLGNVAEKTVTFAGGISQEGADDAATPCIDESEYVEFTINGNTPNKIFKSEEAWRWIVTEVNGSAVSEMEVERTSGLKVYVIWDTPKSPWNQTVGDTANPWGNALEFAVVTCKAEDKATDDLAMSAITTQLYTIPYDGASQCLTPGGNFSYTDYMTTTSANCLDSAVGLDSTGSLLGMDMVAKRRTEFFWYSPGVHFNFHCFVKKGGHVYDSCSAISPLVIKRDYATYITAGDPGAGSVESDETYPLE